MREVTPPRFSETTGESSKAKRKNISEFSERRENLDRRFHLFLGNLENYSSVHGSSASDHQSGNDNKEESAEIASPSSTGKSGLEHEQSKFNKLRERVDKNFEAKKALERRLEDLDIRYERAEGNLQDYENKYTNAGDVFQRRRRSLISSDPFYEKYKALLDDALRKKGNAWNSFNESRFYLLQSSKERVSKATGEYEQAIRKIGELDKNIDQAYETWGELVQLGREQTDKDYKWLTDNLGPEGFDGKTREDLQATYDNLHKKAVKRIDHMKQAPLAAWKALVRDYGEKYNHVFNEMILARESQNDMWEGVLRKVEERMSELSKEANEFYDWQDPLEVQTPISQASQDVSSGIYKNKSLDQHAIDCIHNFEDRHDELVRLAKQETAKLQRATTPNERKEAIRMLEQYANTLEIELDKLKDSIRAR